MANLQIKLTRSLTGCLKKQIATAHSLGLKRVGNVTLQPDTPPTRGKLRVIAHLIQVTEQA